MKKIKFSDVLIIILLVSLLGLLIIFYQVQYGEKNKIPTITEQSKNNSVSKINNPLSISHGVFERNFTWFYDNKKWTLSMRFNESTYDSYQNRSRRRDYDLFASDPYDDELLNSLVKEFEKLAKENNLYESEIPYLVVSFVQSLPYTSDNITTGFDEYPRFPYETLYDNGGDCEDTSVLAAALLQEMGYGVVLIEFEDHIGVGIKGEDISGSYYLYNGEKYYYLETTGENWPVGLLPEVYKNQQAIIKPIIKRPFLDISFVYQYKYNKWDTYVSMNITIKNLGSDSAKNTKIIAALQTENETTAWARIESDKVTILPESFYVFNVEDLYVSTGEKWRVYVRGYGDNVISDEVYGEWIKIKSVT